MESVQTSKPCQVSEDLWMAQHLRYLLLLVRRTGGGQWAISCRVKSRGLKIGPAGEGHRCAWQCTSPCDPFFFVRMYLKLQFSYLSKQRMVVMMKWP